MLPNHSATRRQNPWPHPAPRMYGWPRGHLPVNRSDPTIAGMRRLLHNWLERHRHPASLVLHAVGIPLLIAGLLLGGLQLLCGMWSLWWRPVGLIAVSYVLQWVGHRIEGNDMGEVVVLKKLLGKPYIAIAPRRASLSSRSAVGGGMVQPQSAERRNT